MAAYTMQLKEYIESFSYGENLSHSERIEKGRKYLFDFDYPIFSEAYRKEFETHFIRNFYTREIGSETEELFKFRLETWLQINMPYYNRLFESELIDYDPLTNTHWETSHQKNQKSSMTGEGQTDAQTDQTSSVDTTGQRTNDDFTRNIFSDTPDSRLTLTTKDGEGVLEYATNITEENINNSEKTSGSSDSTGHSEGTQTSSVSEDRNGSEDFEQVTKGKIGSETYAEMIVKHRDSFIRIEQQLFNEMERLFMLVY